MNFLRQCYPYDGRLLRLIATMPESGVAKKTAPRSLVLQLEQMKS